MNRTKTDGRQARDTKYTLCGRPKGVQYQIRTTVDFSGPLAVSLFLLRHNCTASHFFRNRFTLRSLVFLTQISTDELKWDTDVFYFFICVSSVLIRVHLWFVFQMGRLRLIIDCVKKMAGGSKTAYENTRFVLPRERQSYIVTSTNRV